MFRTLGLLRGIACVCVLVVSITALDTTTFTAQNTASLEHQTMLNTLTQKGCKAMEITLHGNGEPTMKCNVWYAAVDSAHAPFTSGTFCNTTDDLHIYQDAFQRSTGAIICFTGTGFLNMNEYGMNLFQNWNDQASSWSSGIWNGTFYVDNNGEGRSENFTYYNTGEFDGQGTHLPNDSLSSIKIDSHR